MIIQLQPDQLIEIWPGVRDGVEKVCRIVTDNPKAMPNVLAGLLAGRYQLWMMLDDTREAIGFIITCISSDSLTGEVYLMLEMVYGFRHISDELARDTYRKLKEYATAYGCDYIKATTSIARAAELLELVGMHPINTNFIGRI